MIIKDKKKFLRAIFIIIGVIVFINILIPDKSFSHQEVKTKAVVVTTGDTLWDIAKVEKESNSYYEDKDIREIIYDIQQRNNLGSSSLKINQVLELPTY